MPVSIEALRNLNKMHLIAVKIPSKPHPISTNGRPWAQQNCPWHVSLYSSQGINNLGGAITYDNTLGDLVNQITSNRLVKLAMSAAQKVGGIAPSIDINRKYLYTGVSNLSFSVQGQLVLDNDIEEDYFVPIEKLAYLTFPERGVQVDVGTMLTAFSNKLSEWAKKNNWDFSLTNSLGSLYNVLGAALGKVDLQTANGEEGFKKLMDFFDKMLGKAYTMQVPPTFNYAESGTGLDFRYGSVLISDVLIKSFRLNVPTLYYQGGYPAAIPVTLELETMRPITASLMTQILMTQHQNIGGAAEGRLVQQNTLWDQAFGDDDADKKQESKTPQS